MEWGGAYSFSSTQTRADCSNTTFHPDAEGGWCPQTTGASEWIQLDLGGTTVLSVNGLITQGHAISGQWVTRFSVSYSMDGNTWVSWGIFTGNSDSFTRVLTVLPTTAQARYLRLWPLGFHGWPSLRWSALVLVPPCSACATGFYSLGINVSTCIACAAPPANAYFFASECNSWKCNTGFRRNGAVCTRCSGSANCLAGQFRPNCTDGLSDHQNCTGACTNRAQNAHAVYLGPSMDNSENACPWGCNQGYYKFSGSLTCVQCPPPCNTGFYLSEPCLSLSAQPIGGPICLACTVPSNGMVTGPGTVAGNASSCPITCNHGFWASGNRQACVAWTATCSEGFAWRQGTAISDANCSICPYAGDQNYVFTLNTCAFTCGKGYELVRNATQCQGCAAGRFKNTTLAVPCARCPANEYQDNPAQPDCKRVPAHGVANNLSTGFTCNDGYFFQPATFGGSFQWFDDTCRSCPGHPVLNASQAVWRGCALLSLTCPQGFYRNWTAMACVACGTAPPDNSIWAPYNASAQFCPTCTGTRPEQDRLVGCPFTCNAGFHWRGNWTFACARCATASCTGGFFPQLCTPPAVSDSCLACSYQLSSNQRWVQQPSCQWQCAAGHTLAAGEQSCALCAEGLFKTAVGNQSCAGCGPGRFAASALSCMGCPAGTYMNFNSASACIGCSASSFAPVSNASECIPCPTTSVWPNAYALATRTACTQCDWATPVWNEMGGCAFATPPCLGGYYQPYESTVCLLCPQGTFCAQGQPPAYCTRSLTSTIPAISVANCSGSMQQPLPNCSGSSITTNCLPPSGTYGVPPQACPYDAYCPFASLVPIGCPLGTPHAPMRSVSVANCTRAVPLPCRAGYFISPLNTSVCQLCLPGCYCPAEGGLLLVCNAAVNFSSPAGATRVEQCTSPGLGSGVTTACPANTVGPTLTQSVLQCRANAGFYYAPGGTAAAPPCPASFHCPVGAVLPVPCPPPPTACPEVGQYPTPGSLCPLPGAVQPSSACQTCVGLPSNAYWTSNVDPSCPFCCQTNFYRYSASACNAQPDSRTCGVGQYMPVPPVCALSVQSCLSCPVVPPAGMDFVNVSVRLTTMQGYGIASGCSASACAAGFRLQIGGGCVACGAGAIKAWTGNDTVCYPCVDNTIANTNRTACIRCPAFSLAWQGVECRCMSGLYLAAGGVCLLCAPGSMTTNGTQTACTQCAAGTRWTPAS